MIALALLVFGGVSTVLCVWMADSAGLRGKDPHAVYLLRRGGKVEYAGITRQLPQQRFVQHTDGSRARGRARWKAGVDEMTVVRWCRTEGQAARLERRLILVLRWTFIAGQVVGAPRRWVGNVTHNRPARGWEMVLVPVWAVWFTARAWLVHLIIRRRVDRVSGLLMDGRFVLPWRPKPVPEAPTKHGDGLLEELGIVPAGKEAVG